MYYWRECISLSKYWNFIVSRKIPSVGQIFEFTNLVLSPCSLEWSATHCTLCLFSIYFLVLSASVLSLKNLVIRFFRSENNKFYYLFSFLYRCIFALGFDFSFDLTIFGSTNWKSIFIFYLSMGFYLQEQYYPISI